MAGRPSGGVTMGVTVKYDVLDRQLGSMTRKLEPTGVNSYRFWLAGPVHQYLQNRAKQNFDENKGGGGSWPPLTEATENWRESYNYPRSTPINIRTGDLLKLMTDTGPQMGFDSIGTYLIYPGNAAMNRNNRKVKMLQAQGILKQHNNKTATPRPVLVFDVPEMLTIMKMFQRFFFDAPMSRG